MKYIDSEKLISELTRMQFDLNAAYRHPQSDSIVRAISLEYDDILSLVDSLQREQPKFKVGDTIHRKGENTVFPMIIESISDVDYACDGGKCFVSIKFQDDYELVQQEQPEVDIVTEYDEQFDSNPVYGRLANRNAGIAIARHFFELGLNARKQ